TTNVIQIEFDGTTYTPDASGVITIDTPDGQLIAYTQTDVGNNVRAGDYQYTLQTNDLLGDASIEQFTYTINDGYYTSTGNLTVNIVDDAPVGSGSETTIQATETLQTYNLVIALDRSGSMGTEVGSTGQTRLEVAQDALAQLFESFDAAGNVNIQIVDFAGRANSSSWYADNITGAEDYLAGLVAAGGNGYSAAIDEVMDNYTPPPADTSLVYFISDGAPSDGFQDNVTLHADWETFLDANNIDISYGIGIGIGIGSANGSALNPIAYPNTDTDGNGLGDYVIQIVDADELAQTLLDTLDNGIVSGSISILDGTGSSGIFVGADGGHIESMVVDGNTYTYVAGVTESIVVTTVLGGTLEVDFVSGEYQYRVDPTAQVIGQQEIIQVTVTDNDGDTLTGTLTINLEYKPPIDANRDTVLTNIANGNDIVISEAALLQNDVMGDAGAIVSVGSENFGSVSATNPVVFVSSGSITDAANFQYTLDYDGATDTTSVDVETAIVGTSIVGGSADEILIGDSSDDTLTANDGMDALMGGQGSDNLDGGLGKDLLIGGVGNDTLTGGDDAFGGLFDTDVFAWELADKGAAGSPAVDVITDFDNSAINSNGDALDLRDLLVDESDALLTEFLFVEIQGGDTLVHISSDGGFTSGVYDSAFEDQTIQISGVDLVSSFGGDQNAIIQDLITRGKLITD
ncbi:MAG: hypothetical protein ACI9Y1_001819, partial [Lentisphaeria bacterium]